MMVLADSEGSLTLLDWLEGYGSSHWVLFVMLALATFLSEDLACICGGLLAAKGWMTIEAAIAACALGIWVGDMGLYWLGYAAANTRKHWKWMDRLVNPQRVAKGRRLFEEHGMKWVFISRFLPGMRLPSFVAAGAVGWSFKKFVFALALGAWMWTPVICGLAYVSGRAVLDWVEAYQRWAWPIIIGLALLVWFLVKIVVPSFTWRGRRLLYSRWTRMRHWEFWPVWAVYPPVALYLLWQAIRFRSVAIFTACDPAIPHSGFALESKGDILDALELTDEDRIRVAKYRRLRETESKEERMNAVEDFLGEEGLSYPVVLKPDVGERGMGVAIMRSREAAENWLEMFGGEGMVQEYIEGMEFGIHWLRVPGKHRGRVESIAGKLPQGVVGDGVQTLEDPILRDARAVMTADYYLAKYEDRLKEVPAEGEKVPLVELGTHARGAVFTDARALATNDLREVLDQIGERYEGFYFGRYDVKVPSEEDLQAGRKLVILELNGVTGEPLHVYQPDYSWWQGMRDLCRHWRRACEIGVRNRDEGRARPSSFRTMLGLIRAHRKQAWFEADVLLRKKADE
jgi:membrane protein DedA with SNARE-associated domain